MNRISRRHSPSLQSTLKDYFVPIVGGIILIVLLYSFFSGGNNTSDTSSGSSLANENKTPTSLSFGVSTTEAYIVYPDDIKEKISESSLLYKGESIIVKEGSIKLLNPDMTSVHLNKIGELKYNIDGSYELYSSDAWFDLKSDTKVSLRYGIVEAPTGSVLSLTQNEAGSTVYVLAGSAKISNLAGVSTSLVKGQKVSVSRLNAANKDLDLSAEKGAIDSYFKGSNWFIDNQGYLVLERQDSQENDISQDTASGETLSGSLDGSYIRLRNLRDEMSVNTSTITISGDIISQDVATISFNNKQAAVSSSNGSFSIENLSLPLSMNDIVVKVYDSDKNILQKSVYTVYTSQVAVNSGNTPSTQVNPNTQLPQNIPASGSSQVNPNDFGFSDPASSGNFSTTSSEVTIRGFTKAKDITAVQVNGFPLASFNGNTWRYHAFTRFETLEEGTNQYKVDYFNESGKVVYSDYYTIVKKQASNTPVTPVSNTNSVKAETTPVSNTPSPESELFAE